MDIWLMEAALGPRQSAIRDCGMEFSKLGLKLFIDQQKCLQGTTDVAVATGDDFVDRGLMKSGTHRKPPNIPRMTTALASTGCCGLCGKAGPAKSPKSRAREQRKVPRLLIGSGR